jgi:hypothetical protein
MIRALSQRLTSNRYFGVFFDVPAHRRSGASVGGNAAAPVELEPIGNLEFRRMSSTDDPNGLFPKVTAEARHWLEYGIFAFVVVTAVATAMAAWYTRREWESSVDNGHRQLRAYVFPDQASFVWQGNAKPIAAEISIKNSGQTPAYKLSTAIAVSVNEFPLQHELAMPSMPTNRTVVAPTGGFTVAVAMPQLLAADQLKAIQNGSRAVYVLGGITYVDAFEECRVTHFRFYYSGSGSDGGGRVPLTYLDEGNMEAECPKN